MVTHLMKRQSLDAIAAGRRNARGPGRGDAGEAVTRKRGRKKEGWLGKASEGDVVMMMVAVMVVLVPVALEVDCLLSQQRSGKLVC